MGQGKNVVFPRFHVGKNVVCPRFRFFLQRLDLARQTAVLAVDEHGGQRGIWLGSSSIFPVISSVKPLLPQGTYGKSPASRLRGPDGGFL